MLRIFDEQHPQTPLGPYGETSFRVFDSILREFSIPDTISIADLGCGRGRLCFWLTLVRKQATVIGLEKFPEFVHRAVRVQKWLRLPQVRFIQNDWEALPLKGIDLVYLYGFTKEEHELRRLAQRLASLPGGTKIISVGFSLEDLLPGTFNLEQKREISFIWGTTEVFLQSVRAFLVQ